MARKLSTADLTARARARLRQVVVPEPMRRRPHLVECEYGPCDVLVDRSAPRAKHKKYCSTGHKWLAWRERDREHAREEGRHEERARTVRRGGLG
jgi:hypothetical protein